MKYKYIILFPIPEPWNRKICSLMDSISLYTKISPPYKKLVSHITFHRPIVGIDEKVVKNLAKSVSLQMKQTKIVVSNLQHFGKQYVVLPVHATRSIAHLWVGLNQLFSSLPEYEHGKFDDDNTLHITVAEKTSEVFDRVWPVIKEIQVKEMIIPVKNIAVYRKLLDGGSWEMVEEYSISK